MQGDLALVGANVVTMDARLPRAEAVLAERGRITRVGTTSEVLAARSPSTDVVDLRGRTVLPGFVDTHVHLMATGLACIGLPLNDCASLDQVLALVRLAPPGESPLRGVGLDPDLLAEGRYPTRTELDEAVGDRAVYLVRRDMHSAVLNTRALGLVPLPLETPGLERDPSTGALSGVLHGEAWYRASLMLSDFVDAATWRRALRAAVDEALAAGCTTVHALEGGFTSADAEVATVAEYAAIGPHPGERHLKVVLWWQTTAVAAARARGLPRVGGCVLVDGSFGSHTAALSEPYADKAEWRGGLYLTDEELERFVGEAHAAGMQVAVHAIGDRAIDQALSAYAKVLAAHPRADHRHRIEHFLLPSEEHVRLAARLGIHLGVQPTFLMQWAGEGGLYEHRLGSTREARVLPLRSLVDQGLVLGGGSDSTVTPLNPLLGVQAAATARNPERRLTPYEALRLYTLDAVRLAFAENEQGTVTPGKAADLVVLGADPLAVSPEAIAAIPVEMTIVDGEQAWP
ncbi:MAG: amidohydrolase [Chloroflexota bacterium]